MERGDRMVKEKCTACYDLGWLVCTVYGSERVPEGTLEIEKCDECEQLKSDDEAEQVPEAKIALAAAQESSEAYQQYMRTLGVPQRWCKQCHQPEKTDGLYTTILKHMGVCADCVNKALR